MINKVRKLIILAMCAGVITVSLTGCGNNSSNADIRKAEKSVSAARIVTDVLGRKVEIPQKVTRVVPLANALRMMCYAQAQDLAVGVEAGEKEKALAKAYNWVYYDVWKDLPAVGEGGSGGYTPYEEEIVSVNPDVIICAYTKEDAEKLQKKTGIPVVVINGGTLFEDDYDKSMKVIGEVCGKEKRCEEVINYIQAIQDDLNNRTKNIKDDEKPSVYSGAVSFKGGHGIEGTYQNFPPFTAINVNSVFKTNEKVSKGVVIDTELILKMNPDIIFLDPNNISLVNEDYKHNPEFYKSLKAVQNGKVYTMLGYNWYYTNVEIAMADCYYAASVVYPEHFTDVDPAKRANDIFSFMLGTKDYYQHLENAGLGFGTIRIGG